MIKLFIWLFTVDYNAPTWEVAVDYCLAPNVECKEVVKTEDGWKAIIWIK